MIISRAEHARWRGMATALLARAPSDASFPIGKSERGDYAVPVELHGCTRDELRALADGTGLPFDVEVEK